MRYLLEFKPKSIKDLKVLPKEVAGNILSKINEISQGKKGNIKKLTNYSPEYRLRVGNYRVLFELEKNKLVIYKVVHRKDAYK